MIKLEKTSSTSSGHSKQSPVNSDQQQQQQSAILMEDVLEIPNKKQHRAYSMEFKLHVLQMAREHGVRRTADYYNLSRKSISEWRNKEAKILELGTQKPLATAKRLMGGGLRVVNEEVEEKIVSWLMQAKQDGPVGAKRIMDTAMKIYREHNGDDRFKASNGWLYRFTKRNKAVFGQSQTTESDPDHGDDNNLIFDQSWCSMDEPGPSSESPLKDIYRSLSQATCHIEGGGEDLTKKFLSVLPAFRSGEVKAEEFSQTVAFHRPHSDNSTMGGNQPNSSENAAIFERHWQHWQEMIMKANKPVPPAEPTVTVDEFSVFGSTIVGRLRTLASQDRALYLKVKKSFEDSLDFAESLAMANPMKNN